MTWQVREERRNYLINGTGSNGGAMGEKAVRSYLMPYTNINSRWSKH